MFEQEKAPARSDAKSGGLSATSTFQQEKEASASALRLLKAAIRPRASRMRTMIESLEVASKWGR
jgi:hypothetical protein